MAEILQFITDENAYRIHVNRSARWLKGRKRHLVEKNLRTDAARFMAALCRAGVSFEEAKGRASDFARDVVDRYNELTDAETCPRCPIIDFRSNAA